MNKATIAMFTITMVVLLAAQRISADECGECDKSACPEVDCPNGLVPDRCNCCPACGLALGAQCGGLQNEIGYCGAGMQCFFSGQEAIDSRTGVCQKKTRG